MRTNLTHLFPALLARVWFSNWIHWHEPGRGEIIAAVQEHMNSDDRTFAERCEYADAKRACERQWRASGGHFDSETLPCYPRAPR